MEVLQQPNSFEFQSHTERARKLKIDIADFSTDQTLGLDKEVELLIKWTNQTYHDENLRSMFTGDWDEIQGISRSNIGRHRNRYYNGIWARANLNTDILDIHSLTSAHEAIQPTGIDIRTDKLIAVATGDEIQLFYDRQISPTMSLRNPEFARLHSVEFSTNGSRVLTVSSSLDLIFELDLNGEVKWKLDLWELGLNTNKLGNKFFRTVDAIPVGEEYLANPKSLDLINNTKYHGMNCLLDDPSKYDRLGLPTNVTPVFVNGVSYGLEDSILATTFHSGEAWVISPTERVIQVIAAGMRNPHGLYLDNLLGGYMVSDTANEQVKYISKDYQEELSVDFASLTERKKGLEMSHWLQNTTNLGDSLYCSVISPRQKITLFDPFKMTKRDIPFDPNWGIQMLKPSS